MDLEITATWNGDTVHIYLSYEEGEWKLQIIPWGSGDGYLSAGPISQLQTTQAIAWAKRSGYSDRFCEILESSLNAILNQARSSVPF